MELRCWGNGGTCTGKKSSQQVHRDVVADIRSQLAAAETLKESLQNQITALMESNQRVLEQRAVAETALAEAKAKLEKCLEIASEEGSTAVIENKIYALLQEK